VRVCTRVVCARAPRLRCGCSCFSCARAGDLQLDGGADEVSVHVHVARVLPVAQDARQLARHQCGCVVVARRCRAPAAAPARNIWMPPLLRTDTTSHAIASSAETAAAAAAAAAAANIPSLKQMKVGAEDFLDAAAKQKKVCARARSCCCVLCVVVEMLVPGGGYTTRTMTPTRTHRWRRPRRRRRSRTRRRR
jgi:hypothetical protein